MTVRSITTEHGTTATLTTTDDAKLITLDNPNAPAECRNAEVGRLVEGGGFQPITFCPWALTPDTLRAIARLIEEADQ